MSTPLTDAQKKALHHCPCGHLIESHDFQGCFASDDTLPCECGETFEGQLFTTTYAVVADMLDQAREQERAATSARIARSIEHGEHRLGHDWSVVCSCLRCEVSTTAARIAREAGQ